MDFAGGREKIMGGNQRMMSPVENIGQELIDFMKEAFNGFCKGSLELLAGRALPMLAEHVRSGEPLESFIYRAEQYEQS